MVIDETSPTIHSSIFRAYDIRGIVGPELNENIVRAIGAALGTKALALGEKAIAVARDGRLSGPALSQALCLGILGTGCDVIDIGMVPTPVLYYSTKVLDTHSGVMVTGSHNPAEYNGLKMMLGGQTLAEESIKHLYHDIIKNQFSTGEGQLSTLDILERYITHVSCNVRLQRPLKVVVDCGNGIAGAVAPELYRRLGCEVIELFCEIDGNFPNHHPDPSQVDNLQELIQAVQTHQADIGLAFDGDGDRLGVVTNRGEIIWPDRQLMLYAIAVLKEYPGAKIIYDVKCTSHLEKIITAHGGKPIMWKTGHSLIKSKLAETHAQLAGEMSGHIFFKDRWYGFDDAIYAGARLLQILANTMDDSHSVFSEIPNSVNTPELKVYVDDDEKFSLMKQLIAKANFKDAELITLDGLRVNFANGWGLVRPSNTTPCLVLRFEADSETILTEIKQRFRDLLLSVKPDLHLPF